MRPTPSYLDPYRRAVLQHGAGFGSLLWASPETQAARFRALVRLADFHGMNVLDAGCGRADFLDFLLAGGIRPAHYVGLEAMPELARAAREKRHANALIVEADFVREPSRLLVGADVVVFCGSLNTMDKRAFYATLQTAHAATAGTLVFNFLASRQLAGTDWLTWHRAKDVLAFARELGGEVDMLDDYYPGDCTIAIRTLYAQSL